jgi:hydrogenase maturation protein HypF
VEGVVQGVGFRPHVFRLAQELGLAGCVGNDAQGVFVELEGSPVALDLFLTRLLEQPPAAAHIERVRSHPQEPRREEGFVIAESRRDERVEALVSPDLDVCAECLAEIDDPANRRHNYPFTNCTNCGPRFTLIESLPYDRPATSMAGFAMCTACQAEYDNPGDRRFHAQPNACPECGPRLSAPLEEAIDCLRREAFSRLRVWAGITWPAMLRTTRP